MPKYVRAALEGFFLFLGLLGWALLMLAIGPTELFPLAFSLLIASPLAAVARFAVEMTFPY